MDNQSNIDLGKRIKNSIVALYVPGEKSDNATYLGKGIILNKEGYVLTAGHLVNNRPINRGKIHYLGDQNIEKYDIVEMVEFLENNDLAIIKTRFSDSDIYVPPKIKKEFSYNIGTQLQLIDIEKTPRFTQ